MRDLKNVVEIKNKFICAQVLDHVERFTRVIEYDNSGRNFYSPLKFYKYEIY
jgi:hypothetical protein